MIVLKTKEEIKIMRRAGKVVGRTLDMVQNKIEPGMTTGELNVLIDDFIRAQEGGYSRLRTL